MTVDSKQAAASLGDIAHIERRTREALYYGGSAEIFILWGVLTAIGHLLTWFVPGIASWSWLAIDIAGFLATVAVVLWRMPHAAGNGIGLRWVASYAAFAAFGAIVMLELWPMTGRQQQVFWPTLVMFAYVLAGIWVGRFFLYLGLVATALILIGFYVADGWFQLWLAATVGGGLIAAGVWLRRAAA